LLTQLCEGQYATVLAVAGQPTRCHRGGIGDTKSE
jgi:hypothetical protein